jgi:hypothetical protein
MLLDSRPPANEPRAIIHTPATRAYRAYRAVGKAVSCLISEDEIPDMIHSVTVAHAWIL